MIQMTFATNRAARMKTVLMLATATFVSQDTANTDVKVTLPSCSADGHEHAIQLDLSLIPIINQFYV